jgi:hypothetical protein
MTPHVPKRGHKGGIHEDSYVAVDIASSVTDIVAFVTNR